MDVLNLFFFWIFLARYPNPDIKLRSQSGLWTAGWGSERRAPGDHSVVRFLQVLPAEHKQDIHDEPWDLDITTLKLWTIIYLILGLIKRWNFTLDMSNATFWDDVLYVQVSKKHKRFGVRWQVPLELLFSWPKNKGCFQRVGGSIHTSSEMKPKKSHGLRFVRFHSFRTEPGEKQTENSRMWHKTVADINKLISYGQRLKPRRTWKGLPHQMIT